MNFADVQDDLGTAVDAITGLRVSVFEPASVTGPTAIFRYPNSLMYHETNDGLNRLELAIVVAVPNPMTKQARNLLAAYTATSGASSIKAKVEAAAGTSFATAEVTQVVFDGIEIGNVQCAAAIMTITVTGA